MKSDSVFDEDINEAWINQNNYHQLTAEELTEYLSDNSIQGSYLRGFTYEVHFSSDGTMAGVNNVNSHNLGTWVINAKEHTLTVQWDNGWDHTTTRAYQVGEGIKLFDTDTGKWRTSFKHQA